MKETRNKKGNTPEEKTVEPGLPEPSVGTSAESDGSSEKKGRKRGKKGPRVRWAILDVSGLPIYELIEELYGNALCIYGLQEDKTKYPTKLTRKEIEKAISEERDIHIWHGRHLGGLDIKRRTLNATLYNKYNCECLEAKEAGREVKSAEKIIEELKKR